MNAAPEAADAVVRTWPLAPSVNRFGVERKRRDLAGKAVYECEMREWPTATTPAGRDGMAPPLVPQEKIYEPGIHGERRRIISWRREVASRAHHWPFGDMPPVEGIEDAQIERIVTYVRELQRANGIL